MSAANQTFATRNGYQTTKSTYIIKSEFPYQEKKLEVGIKQ